jgi:AcrR family transcriptional regulator
VRGGEARGRAEHLGPERRRPLMLDAALRLFVERGYRGTSMEGIAEAAGVTKPVVYDCYPSKERLFRALLDREEERLLGEVQALPSDADYGDIEALFASTLEAFLSGALTAPDSWRILFDSEHAEPLVARRLGRARAAVVAQVAGLVEPYLRAQGARDVERKAPVLAEVLASIGEAGVRLLLVEGREWTPGELAPLLARVAARGVTAA